MTDRNDSKNYSKDHYGFEVREINKPDDMTDDRPIHYVYHAQDAKIHFLYSPAQNSKGLLIAFHGARVANYHDTGEMAPLPLFRGYDYTDKIGAVSVLSVCDPLLYEYSRCQLRLAWFLDTARFQSTGPIIDIVEHARRMEKSDNLLFFGSSGGGFPAIKYAGILKRKALLSNSQLILDKYSYFAEFINILSENNDRIVESHNICQLLGKSGYPEKIVLYVNKLDTHHFENHAEPFYNFMKNSGHLNILDYNAFEGHAPQDQKPHAVQWNDELKDIILKALE